MHTALEFEFNVEVARTLGTPLMPVVAGQERKVEEIVDAVRMLAQALEEKKCDVLSMIVNRVAPDDLPRRCGSMPGSCTCGGSRVSPAGPPSPRQTHSCRNKEGSPC